MKKLEFHYAPTAGHGSQLICYRNGYLQKVNGWSGFNDLIEEFINLRENREIELLRTEEFGHVLFAGHHGRVDIYGTLE